MFNSRKKYYTNTVNTVFIKTMGFFTKALGIIYSQSLKWSQNYRAKIIRTHKSIFIFSSQNLESISIRVSASKISSTKQS